jgi:hypothetical protein
MNETEFFKKIKPVENQVGATTTKEDEFFKSLGVSQEGETQETKQDLTTAQNIGDITASGIAGSATGLSYLLDIPQIVSDGLQFVTDKIYGAVLGEESLQKVRDVREKIKPTRIEPGKLIRENIIENIYQPKTKAGEYAFTAGEFAAPGGLFAKGAKARQLFATTGAASGLVAQGAEDISGSQGFGTGVGIGTNIGLDLLALRRGNLAALAKDIMPSESVIAKTRATQKAASEGGLPLTVGEASEAAGLKAAEANVASQMINAKVVDDYYLTRPKKLENYIKNFGKDQGLLKTTFTGRMSDSTLASSLKKSANLLQANRQRLWENSGGLKFRDSVFDSQEVDNLGITLENILNKSNIPEVQQSLAVFLPRIRASNARGNNLHNIYKDINDLNFNLKGNLTKTTSDRELIQATETLKNDLKQIFSKNKDFAKANEVYQTFTKNYFEPLEKFKIFKKISASRWETNMDTVGKLYRLLGSNSINRSDITKIAKSFEATGDKKAWTKIVSSYFDNNFLKAQASNPDLSKGVNFYKALVGSPRQRDNVTEMLYQVAKQKGYKGSRSDILNSVKKFAEVLRASGGYIRSGSPTAIRKQMEEELGKNIISTGTRGIPVLSTIDNFFKTRTYSQNSKALAEALLSPNGIDELINLAKKWKDKNASIIYTRNIILTAKAIEEINEDLN